MKKALIASVLLIVSSAVVNATPSEVSQQVSGASLKGTATASLFGKELYDAQLYTVSGEQLSYDKHFALTLNYKVSFTVAKLVWGTVHEMARIEGVSKSKFDDLKPKLAACFADVTSGDRITGMSESSQKVSFYYNGKKRCSLSYPDISKRFFGIWLGPKARDGASAKRLKGS